MSKKIGVSVVSLVLTLLIAISAMTALAPLNANASIAEQQLPSRLINIVYDDSSSMHENGSPAWCQAKYSLEVFSAMMQEKDTMNIYFMSQFAQMTEEEADRVKPLLGNLSGDSADQQNNIDRIHKEVTYTKGTYFRSIKKAYSDLNAASDSYDEKWFVVITDGDSFTDEATAPDLDDLFSDCDDDRIKIVYLAIGDQAIAPMPNEAKGLYVYKAAVNASTSENGILARVTEICQRIFQRPSVNKKETNAFTLDIPASEIVIFAQGKSVEIGDLDGARKTVSSASMTQADKDKATRNNPAGEIKVTELSGTIVTFTPSSGNYFKEGKYDIPISADEYEVYYKPCLDVILNLKNMDGKIVTDDYIPVGAYTIEYWLSYPVGHDKHGEKIPATLFDVTYDRYANINGRTETLSSDTVQLDVGGTELSVVANYLNFISSVGTAKFIVEDFTIEKIDVTLEYKQSDYRLSTLETENEGILVKVEKDGAPIALGDWGGYQLETRADKLDFEVVKNDDSTFMIYPRYANGERSKTATGDVPFEVDVYATNDHRKTYEGVAAGKINIYDDVSSVELGVTVDEQNGDINNKNFNDNAVTRKVTIDWAGKTLTKAQYDALKLSVEMDDPEISASIKADPYVEGEPTTATVTFKSKIDDIIKLNGDHDFTVQAEIQANGEKSVGSAEDTLEVKDARTAWEIFLDILPVLLIILLIIFILCAYVIFKKYLPAKIICATGRIAKTYYPYKNIGTLLTILIPFMPVCTSITLSKGLTLSATFRLRASGKNTAICMNMKRLNGQGYTVNGSKTARIALRSSTIMYRQTMFARFQRR